MTRVSVDHVGLTVADLEGSLGFFRDVLGLSEQRRSHTAAAAAAGVTGVAGAEIDHAFLDVDGGTLELLQYRVPAPASPATTGPEVPGSMHLALQVDDLDGTLAAARPHGWVPAGHPVTVTAGPRTGSTMTYLRDASGATLELIEPPRQSRDA